MENAESQSDRSHAVAEIRDESRYEKTLKILSFENLLHPRRLHLPSMFTRNQKILASLSAAVVFASALFAVFTKTAATSIPRSKALFGLPQSKNGDTNIVLLGLDSRRDNDGNNLPRKLLNYMHVGSSSSVGGYNTNTMIVIHIPKTGKATAISIPRDDYVEVPGLGFKKIKEAYGYAKYAEDSRL